MMADYCTQFVIHTPYFRDGFPYQTGVGGMSIASTISLGKIMEERGSTVGLGAIGSIRNNPNHVEISASEYVTSFNKWAYVNKPDFVFLAALEVDVNFNCNMVAGSDGVIIGA